MTWVSQPARLRKAGASEPAWRALRALEDRLSPEAAAQIERVLDWLGHSADTPEIMAALARGDTEAALNAIPWPQLNGKLDRAIRPMILKAYAEGARTLAMDAIQQVAPTMALGFDLVNSPAVEAAALRSAELVREVSDETKAAIRAVVARGQAEGRTVAQQGREIRQLVGLTTRQATAVQTYRRGLEVQGMRPERIETLTDQQTARAIRYRADMIARTETIRSSNDGQRALWADAQTRGLLPEGQAQVWIASPDACDVCRDLDGETAPIGEPFASGDMGPPAHPQCRCALGLDVAAVTP